MNSDGKQRMAGEKFQ